MALQEEYGFIGNIWVRQNYLEKAGDAVGGHQHYFDHVSLLAQGKVEVTIDDNEPKVFEAPTFIVIRKNHRHNIRALVDNTYWYCVFAVRDIYGDQTDIIPEGNDPAPWYTSGTKDFWDKREFAEKLGKEEIDPE